MNSFMLSIKIKIINKLYIYEFLFKSYEDNDNSLQMLYCTRIKSNWSWCDYISNGKNAWHSVITYSIQPITWTPKIIPFWATIMEPGKAGEKIHKHKLQAE